MQLNIYQVDAFASRVFAGNPAAVCPLEHWLSDETMQQIARENNLSETVFFLQNQENYGIRWFTPKGEVDLCGHATLAAAHVIFHHMDRLASKIVFSTEKRGLLTVIKDGSRYVMDFPALNPQVIDLPPQKLLEAVDVAPLEVLGDLDYMLVYENQHQIENLTVDLSKLVLVDKRGLIVTAQGDSYDCVSRCFYPKNNVPEDPVTGSAHCAIVPYWAKKRHRSQIKAFQASERGGALDCELHGDRVMMSGQAQTYLEGRIYFSI